jgi:hypothetical protein
MTTVPAKRSTCRNCGQPIVYTLYFVDVRDGDQPVWFHPGRQGGGHRTCSINYRGVNAWPVAEPWRLLSPARSPVRRGTASKLGLSTPYSRPGGIIRVQRRLTDDQMRDLVAKFEEQVQIGRYGWLIEDRDGRVWGSSR